MENENQELEAVGNSLMGDVFGEQSDSQSVVQGQEPQQELQQNEPQQGQGVDEQGQQLEQPQQPEQNQEIDYQALTPQQIEVEYARQLLEQMQQRDEYIQQQLEQMRQQIKQELQGQSQEPQENNQIEAIKKELGLDEIERQNQELQEKLKAQEEFMQQQRVQAELNSIKAQYPDFDEQAVSKKIFEILEQTPEEIRAEAAAFLDSPAGWRMIHEQIRLQSAPKEPKNTIVTNQSGGAKVQKTGNEFIDIGNSILGLS